MRARLRLLAILSTALTIGLVAPALVRAATVEQLVDLAVKTYAMACASSADGVTCTGGRLHPGWSALIKPATGPEESLQTAAQANPPLDSSSRSWITDMHQTACGAPTKVADFVNQVGDLTEPATLGPVSIGTCTFTGGLSGPGTAAPEYHVESAYVPPPPTPTAAPVVTPKPTPKATPKPTPRPTPTPVPSEPPTGATPSPVPSPTASPSIAPNAATTVKPPTFTPTQEVAAATSVAEPSAPPPAAPPPALRPHPPAFADSIVAADKVNTDVGAIGGSVAAALLLLLIIGFAGELFNNTIENNYDVVAGWLGKGTLGRASAWLGRNRRGGVLAFVALTALVSSFVDPSFGPDSHGLAEFLGFLVGLVVVLASFKLPPMLAHRRETGELGRLRPLPWALAIAAAFVLVSRIGNLQPGYLYGIVLGAIFVTEVSDVEEGRETFYGSVWTLAVAVIAWLGLTWLRGAGFATGGFGVTLLSTAFAAVLVAGLEATAFGLMPLRFMPGYPIYRWSRLAWALLFGLSVFAFIHILIGPTSGYVSELSPAAFVAALGVFAAFGALSIATWLFFRFRRPEPA